MARIISIHEYDLRPEVNTERFEEALLSARKRGLLQLPGLVEHRFLRRIRGSRQSPYAALWVYESRERWEKLWGPVGCPIRKQDYPRNWITWEDEVLAPFLSVDPDRIDLAAYEELG